MAPPNSFPWAQHRSDVIRWRNEGVSVREIANRLGVSKGMVSGQLYALRKNGDIPGGVMPKALAPNRKFPWTAERDGQIRDMRAKGLPYVKIASAMGIAQRTIHDRARALGLVSAPVLPDGQSVERPCCARVWSVDERERIVVLYVDQKMTITKIASEFQSTRKRITKLLRTLEAAGVLVVRDDRYEARLSKAEAKKPEIKKPQLRATKQGVKTVPKPRRQTVKHLGSLSEVLESMKAPAKAGVSLMDLRGMNCRWPLICDDGEIRYCGEGVTDRPYCAHHAARAFNGKERPRVPPAVLGLGVRQGGRVDA